MTDTTMADINERLSADRVRRVENLRRADKLHASYCKSLAAHYEAVEQDDPSALRHLMEATMAYAEFRVAKGGAS